MADVQPAVPQAVADALSLLVTDRSNLDSRYADKSAADQILAQATNAAAVAGNALDADKQAFNRDKGALITLIQTTFTDAPPAGPVAPQ